MSVLFTPARFTAAFALLALPWLNPFAPGPSPAVVPWLVALAASAGLILTGSLRPASGEATSGAFPVGRWAAPAAWAWVFAGAASSVIGLLQYFGAAGGLEPGVSQTLPGEAFANLRQRNHFASLTNIALVALVWLGASGRLAGRPPGVVWAVAGLLAIGNAASSSRTGLLQLLGLCVLFWVWGGWRQQAVRRLLLAAILAYAVAAPGLPWLAGFDLWGHGMAARMRAGDGICFSRLTLWSNVLQLISEKPWLGWGWGELDYAHYMTLYPGDRFCDILDNAHNLPLHLAVELGIPLAALVGAVFVWLLVHTQPWRETDPARQMAWGVLAVILLHSMLEYPLSYGPFQMAAGVCLLLLWRPSLESAAGPTVRSLLARSARAGLAAALLVGAGYAAFDYHRVSQIYLAPAARSATYREDTLNKIRGSWLFRNQVRFAELSTTPLTGDNAQWTYATAALLLHYSPEPRVIEKMIESAVMLGRDDEALQHLLRYRAAFPKEHEKWRSATGLGPLPLR